MTVASELAAALSSKFGPAETTIHTDLPPYDNGQSAEVLEFRQSSSPGGVVYVSVSANSAVSAWPEFMLVTRQPEDWAPALLAIVAAAEQKNHFESGGTLTIGTGPVGGIAFTVFDGLFSVMLGKRRKPLLLALGVTARELAACRARGVDQVVHLLKAAGQFPFTEEDRADVPAVLAVGGPVFDHPGLSEQARDGLRAVVRSRSQEVEQLRGELSTQDLAILAESYSDLGTFVQRSLLLQFIQDNNDPSVLKVCRRFLHDAAVVDSIGEWSVEHGSIAVALMKLDSNSNAVQDKDQRHERFMYLADNLAAALAAAREYVAGQKS
jgi:hypothetical protein